NFKNVGTLIGGSASDYFLLQAAARLSGSIDGGAGLNTVQGPGADMTWTAYGQALAPQADRVAFTASTTAITAVNGKELTLAESATYQTGQAVIFHTRATTGTSGQLKNNQTYYVVVPDPNQPNIIELAASLANALNSPPQTLNPGTPNLVTTTLTLTDAITF